MIFADPGTYDPIAIVQSGGVVALLILIILGGYKRLWVWGYQLRDAEKAGDEWKAIALRSTNLAESLSELSPRSSQ